MTNSEWDSDIKECDHQREDRTAVLSAGRDVQGRYRPIRLRHWSSSISYTLHKDRVVDNCYNDISH